MWQNGITKCVKLVGLQSVATVDYKVWQGGLQSTSGFTMCGGITKWVSTNLTPQSIYMKEECGLKKYLDIHIKIYIFIIYIYIYIYTYIYVYNYIYVYVIYIELVQFSNFQKGGFL